MKTGLIIAGCICCIFIINSCSSDQEAPTVSITAPHDDDTICVHTSMISAEASDNNEVEYVEFFVENSLVSTDSAVPYETSWSIASYQNMDVISISGRAYDASENMGQSDVITVTVMTRGMVTNTRTDTVYILDQTWIEWSNVISNAPDSAVVDSIVVSVTIQHQQIADVDVYLKAPSGTEVQLWDNDFNTPTDTVMTTSFENEDINGTWLLRFYDEVANGLMGFATDFTINIYWKF
jgi:subtilisin-like proprotein convertase family protein